MFCKKHIARIFAVLFSLVSANGFSQPILNYHELADGNVRTFREKKIQSLTLLEADRPVKTIKYDSLKNTLMILNGKQDTLYTMYYNSCDFLYKVSKSNRYFYIHYPSSATDIPFKEMKYGGAITDTLERISNPYPENPDIKQKENYVFSKASKDTLEQLLITTVLNRNDDQWSYQLTKKKGYTDKKYYNGINVSRSLNGSMITYDSVVPGGHAGNIRYQHQYILDSVFTKIIKDTTYESLTVAGKKIYEKTLLGTRSLNEVHFVNNSDTLKKVSYRYYPTTGEKPVLWQKTETNFINNKTKKIYPNRKAYNLRNGVLIKRKKDHPPNLQLCAGVTFIVTHILENFWLPSSSILFPVNTHFFDKGRMVLLLDHYKQLPEDEFDIQSWDFAYSRDSASKYDRVIDVPGKKLLLPPYSNSSSLQFDSLKLEIETAKGVFYQPINSSDVERKSISFYLIYFKTQHTKRK
ncbi:MAG: hypothetical protein QM594_22655 [Niabella sp.]